MDDRPIHNVINPVSTLRWCIILMKEPFFLVLALFDPVAPHNIIVLKIIDEDYSLSLVPSPFPNNSPLNYSIERITLGAPPPFYPLF